MGRVQKDGWKEPLSAANIFTDTKPYGNLCLRLNNAHLSLLNWIIADSPCCNFDFRVSKNILVV